MANKLFNKIHYIYWKDEAIKESLDNDAMVSLVRELEATRTKVTSKTKREDYTEETYRVERHGDWCEVFLWKNNNYHIYYTNGYDRSKNEQTIYDRPDRKFEMLFRQEHDITLRRAFGFVDKTFKRNIPKQFYYINNKYRDKSVIASSIDASSQYPSGCLGRLPDSHTAITVKGRVAPTEEYPFAFYKSGHVAEYGVFDTHEWLSSKYFNNLFRLDFKEYSLIPLRDDEEETVLMKASKYEMTDIWNRLYDIKKSASKDSNEYKEAKLMMNKTIGCWHKKDAKAKNRNTYDDEGSYKLAHIVAIAIGRGNQKILNKIKEIGQIRVIHVCVDGIIYLGDDVQGITESKLGVFAQEFTGCKFLMKDINVYGAEDKKTEEPVKFKHGSYDLIDGKEFDENIVYSIRDLAKLGRKTRIGDIING